MAKCGTYKIPKGLAGIDSICKGGGDYGLDSTFAKAVTEFVEYELNQKGYNVRLGNRGYVSKADAMRMAVNGKPGYQKNLDRFGWGLAWEILSVTKDGENISTSVMSTFALAGFQIAMNRRGITFKEIKENGVTSLRFFTPANVNKLNDVGSGRLEQDGGDSSSSDESVVAQIGEGGESDASASGQASIASASYFFANQFNAVVDVAESYMLTGERALANDVDLWTYVKRAVNASLRTCSSDPDGNFIAWYPDYFGKAGKTPKVIIKDVELEDLTITQSDAEFYTHVFCPGVTADGSTVNKWLTTGVVSIEGAAAAEAASGLALQGEDVVSSEPSPLLENILNIPDGEGWKYSPKELYRRYGARPAKTDNLPNYQSGVLIEATEDLNNNDSDDTPSQILPYLYALYNFMFHWAQQYKADIKVTFMPELFPGMRIKVESLDIEFYVQSVSHNMSYTGGFTTSVGAICPVGSLVSGMIASPGGEA